MDWAKEAFLEIRKFFLNNNLVPDLHLSYFAIIGPCARHSQLKLACFFNEFNELEYVFTFDKKYFSSWKYELLKPSTTLFVLRHLMRYKNPQTLNIQKIKLSCRRFVVVI